MRGRGRGDDTYTYICIYIYGSQCWCGIDAGPGGFKNDEAGSCERDEIKFKALSTWLSCDERRQELSHKAWETMGDLSQLDCILEPRYCAYVHDKVKLCSTGDQYSVCVLPYETHKGKFRSLTNKRLGWAGWRLVSEDVPNSRRR